MMVSKDAKELPLFIPPRKRQLSKKCNGSHNYVDHIVTVQGRTVKQSPSGSAATSPNADAPIATSTNKSIDNLSLLVSSGSASALRCAGDLNACRPLAKSNEHTLHELHKLHSDVVRSSANGGGGVDGHHHQRTTTTTPDYSYHRSKESSRLQLVATTPSSCYSADSGSMADARSQTNRSSDCLTGFSANKKRVNYRGGAAGIPPLATSNNDPLTQMTAESGGREISSSIAPATATASSTPVDTSRRQLSFSRYTNTIGAPPSSGGGYLTMTGTVKRGRKKGQSVDLQVNMSREELEHIQSVALASVGAAASSAAAMSSATSSTASGKNGKTPPKKALPACCQCSPTVGLHVLLLSLLCAPFVALATAVYSFYIGTLTWYNMFNLVAEERPLWLRVVLAPVLVLLYPVLIVLCTIGLGVYAGAAQLSVRFHSWANEVADVEKGFYGWLCSVLRMSDCSPYEEVVVLVDLRGPEGGEGGHQVNTTTSTEELSL